MIKRGEDMANNFANLVVVWQKTHGRNDLPWQHSRDPYRVWISEIMLQQTQVATVLNYFSRFLERFPNVTSLAAATLDDVLGLWSGLGYYSRARNLHSCANEVVNLHGGLFPQTAHLLQTLPGIGRSTAAAIAAMCFAERVAILDGNVKRLLTRWLGFDADLANAANERQLWDQALRLLPLHDLAQTMPRYTQGVMDLGATVCSAKSPDCQVCPVANACVARRLGQTERYPVKTRKLKRSKQVIWLLWVQSEEAAVWLSKRPTPGVWAGLYCFPWFDSRVKLQASVPARYRKALHDGAPFMHTLTHKDLLLCPVQLQVPSAVMARLPGAWIGTDEWPRLGLPAPVRKLLAQRWSG